MRFAHLWIVRGKKEKRREFSIFAVQTHVRFWKSVQSFRKKDNSQIFNNSAVSVSNWNDVTNLQSVPKTTRTVLACPSQVLLTFTFLTEISCNMLVFQ